MKRFLKENYKFMLFVITIVLLFTIKLPYYIMGPGGNINITNRVEMDGYKVDKGSINMLYVSEWKMTPASFLIAKLKGYEINSINELKVSNETIEEIEIRNKIMRDNSLDIATMVAYNEANKKIAINGKENVVIATTNDNDFKVGDIILEVNNKSDIVVDDIKNEIDSGEVGDNINFKVLRGSKEINIQSKIVLEDNRKVVGIVVLTDYEFDMDPKINIKFKNSESGSSGGLMLTLTIYNAISDIDLIKGRDIAGTGTIGVDGTVGEIDGVKYKIMGASKNNMDIVFVPSANYEEAINTCKKYNYDLKVVKVDTFNEVVEYLKNN